MSKSFKDLLRGLKMVEKKNCLDQDKRDFIIDLLQKIANMNSKDKTLQDPYLLLIIMSEDYKNNMSNNDFQWLEINRIASVCNNLFEPEKIGYTIIKTSDYYALLGYDTYVRSKFNSETGVETLYTINNIALDSMINIIIPFSN